MAKPRYIICSQDRLVDQATGMATHVNVVEKFAIKEERSPEPLPNVQYAVPNLPIAKMILTAVWAREAGDSESDEFEFEVLIHKPEDESITLQKGEFSFPPGLSYFRIDSGIIFTTHTKFKKGGTVVLENRIKKRGSDEWKSQEFPIEIEVTGAEAANVGENSADSANQ